MQRSDVIRLDASVVSSHRIRASQLEVEFEPETGTLWGWLDPTGTPCFNLGLLNDIRVHDSLLEANGGKVLHQGAMHEVHTYVGASRTPGVFNLGGDLALFVLLIKSREREALAHYAKLCIDNVYRRVHNYRSPWMTTISLVQGDALGGGFETALSSDIIIAEEGAQLGLPEILFNLIPGMGAFSLLSRKIGMRAAEDLIASGKILPAKTLHEMGVVDVLAKEGEGVQTVRQWIARNQRRRGGYQALQQARRLVNPVTREELDAIVDVWVDAALRLDDRDLKMMSRIVRSQMRRMEGGSAAANANADETQEAISSGA
jgi:DSF synthase